MIDLQNPYAYEASLNNILHKVPLEAGVERVVITLLNDILSHLCKWPGLSTEDTSSIKQLKKFGLEYSRSPDGMILDNSGTYQRADGKGAKLQPRALIETKMLGIDPYRKEAVFEGKGVIKLLRMSKNGKIPADEISEIFKWCGNEFTKTKYETDKPVNPIPTKMPNVAEIVPHWSSKESDRAYDAGTEFAFTFKDGTKVKLYQLDWYLLDLYYGNCRYVIWTNGLVWKIFAIEGGTLKSREFNLGKNVHGHIQDGYTGNIQIKQHEFNALINYLKSILSTL